MEQRVGTAQALLSVGVLLVVIGNLLDNDLEVWLSVAGAVLAVVGFVMYWRNRRSGGSKTP